MHECYVNLRRIQKQQGGADREHVGEIRVPLTKPLKVHACVFTCVCVCRMCALSSKSASSTFSLFLMLLCAQSAWHQCMLWPVLCRDFLIVYVTCYCEVHKTQKGLLGYFLLTCLILGLISPLPLSIDLVGASTVPSEPILSGSDL